MTKKVTLLPPFINDYINYEIEGQHSEKQDGFNLAKANRIQVKSLTESEAEEYGELLKQEFIKKWRISQTIDENAVCSN